MDATLKANTLHQELQEQGLVVLPGFVSGKTLTSMQRSFACQLRRLRWNDFDGYEKTERYRHMVQNVLTLDQGFVDVALHPCVKEVLHEYLGSRFELVEAKGWLSLPVRSTFHGWHGDAWYDQTRTDTIPREVKLGLYLTDVQTGGFAYIKGSHGKQAPRPFARAELEDIPADPSTTVSGSAGTAFLFDTSGIHCQSSPILEPRHAVFFNYHDPDVPLQEEDVQYYRYHPLILNAAFLGDLDEEDQRILGFGNKTNYLPCFERRPQHAGFQALMRWSFDSQLRVGDWWGRITRRLSRIFRRA